jgi:hypothetical protein
LLHSIPRQELGIEALGESELGLLEWRMRACSMGKWSGQEWRAIGGGCVYIGLSQESRRWAKIQNSDKVWGGDNVRLGPTTFGWVGQWSVGSDNVRLGLYELGALLGRSGQSPVGPNIVRLEVSVCGWI